MRGYEGIFCGVGSILYFGLGDGYISKILLSWVWDRYVYFIVCMLLFYKKVVLRLVKFLNLDNVKY